MELSIVDGDSANLLRFNLPVLSREERRVATAYSLMDGGASHKFVAPSMVEAIEEAAGEKMERRNRGNMELTSAGKVEYLPRVQVKLKIAFGRFKYSGWFTLYNLVKYDIIFGKDWMEEIKHDVDHATNVITIHPVGGIGPVRLRGLVRGVGREGGISEGPGVTGTGTGSMTAGDRQRRVRFTTNRKKSVVRALLPDRRVTRNEASRLYSTLTQTAQAATAADFLNYQRVCDHCRGDNHSPSDHLCRQVIS
jgi:hypothetical protein